MTARRQYNDDPAIHAPCCGDGHKGGKHVTQAVRLRVSPSLVLTVVLCSPHLDHVLELMGAEMTEAWPDAVPADRVAA